MRRASEILSDGQAHTVEATLSDGRVRSFMVDGEVAINDIVGIEAISAEIRANRMAK